MSALHSRCGHYIFDLSFLLSFFLAYSQPLQIGCLPYFHTWCGLSANLGCRSETCCTRLAESTGFKKSPKISHLRTITQLCRAISWQIRHILTIGKKLVKQQYLPHMSTIWWTSAHWRLRSVDQFGAPQLISTGFTSLQRYCTAL